MRNLGRNTWGISRRWYSGSIRPCHGRDPGSIPGRRSTPQEPLALLQEYEVSGVTFLIFYMQQSTDAPFLPTVPPHYRSLSRPHCTIVSFPIPAGPSPTFQGVFLVQTPPRSNKTATKYASFVHFIVLPAFRESTNTSSR